METGQNIEFNQSKHFKFVRELGRGGAGITHLFNDETTNTYFAIKKYNPSLENINHKEEMYDRFVEEIKILFKLSHPNIVRIYNYYLYPEYKLGYLQMEYIDGVPLDEYISSNNVNLEEVFRSIIGAFVCLEENGILHRDIRASNIMVDNDGKVKIIDFGFGKDLEFSEQENSVMLNWPATEYPFELVNDENYIQETEVYFLGYLIRKLLLDNDVQSFQFNNILNKMCQRNLVDRYSNFKEVSSDITKGVLLDLNFTDDEKYIYQNLADYLSIIIKKFKNNFDPISDPAIVISKLEKVLKSNALEYYIQNHEDLINVFLNNNYTYVKNTNIKVEEVKDFYEMLVYSELDKKNIILENLETKLSNIPIELDDFDIDDDELPF